MIAQQMGARASRLCEVRTSRLHIDSTGETPVGRTSGTAALSHLAKIVFCNKLENKQTAVQPITLYQR